MNVHITELDLKEFKGIKAMKKPMKLSRFNVLIGRNNSGKSSILQALFLFPEPIRKIGYLSEVHPLSEIDAINLLTLEKKYFKSEKLRSPAEKWYTKVGSRLIFGYSGKAYLNYHTSNNNKILINLDYFNNSEVILNIEKEKKRLTSSDEFKNLGFSRLEDYSIYIPNDTFFMELIEEYTYIHEEEINKKGLHKKITKIINKVLDEKFTEVVWKKDGLSLRKKDATYIRLSDVGTGVIKAVTTMIALENINPQLVLWDDFDVGMHPSLIKVVLEWLNSHKDWQVVLSTHSIDVLYHILDLKNTKDVEIHLLRKRNDILESKAIGVEELEDWIDANTDPRLLVDVMKI